MYDNTHFDLSQPLIDTSANGRRQPWAEHRSGSDILAYVYDDIDEAKAARLRSCAPRLIYTIQDDNGAQRIKLHTAWFCRVRLCPVCQWRRSLKIYGQASEVVRAANASRPGGYGWIMLTLTMRNVDGKLLPAAIDKMGKAWHRLLKLDAWQRAVVGCMRSLEVTHNTDIKSDAYDTYHPHFHALLCVLPSYFTGRNYLSRLAWAQLWQRALRVDYTPQIWVSRIKGDSAAAIAEVTKYASKPSDYIDPSDLDAMAAAVAVLDKALARRRLVAWTGNLKTIHAALQLDDAENGNLVHTDIAPEEDVAADEHMRITFAWLREHRNYYREVDANAET